jgi:hypothetical protein
MVGGDGCVEEGAAIEKRPPILNIAKQLDRTLAGSFRL